MSLAQEPAGYQKSLLSLVGQSPPSRDLLSHTGDSTATHPLDFLRTDAEQHVFTPTTSVNHIFLEDLRINEKSRSKAKGGRPAAGVARALQHFVRRRQARGRNIQRLCHL